MKFHSNQSYYMHGKHAVISALKNPKRIIKQVLCTEESFNQNKQLISKYKYDIVKDTALTKIIGQNQNHQGIVAQVFTVYTYDLTDLVFCDKIAILDQITDPQNIGSIIRSAAAFNIEAIIMPIDNNPTENAAVAKAASGGLELVKIIKVTNLKSVIDHLKSNDFWIMGLDGRASDILDKSMYSKKIAFIFGSEDRGLRQLTKRSCDYLVKIPISKTMESLNVSNAAAIIFHWSSLQSN